MVLLPYLPVLRSLLLMRRHDTAVCCAHRIGTPTQEIRKREPCISDCVAVGHLFAWIMMQAY